MDREEYQHCELKKKMKKRREERRNITQDIRIEILEYMNGPEGNNVKEVSQNQPRSEQR